MPVPAASSARLAFALPASMGGRPSRVTVARVRSLMQEKIDPVGLKLAQQVEEIWRRSSELIDRPWYDEIHLAPRHCRKHRVKARIAVAGLSIRDPLVTEDPGVDPPRARGDLVQVAKLVLDRLTVHR